jgi:hypothetical protein
MRSRFALLAAVLLCAWAAAARTPVTRIRVAVVDAEGKPIEHADVQVSIMKGDKPRPRWKLRTHEEGTVDAPDDSPQGTYLVEVVAPEFLPFSQQYEVHDIRQTLEVKMISAMAKLNVRVTSLSGKPVEHADVVVKFIKGRSIILLGKAISTSWEMRTNQEGVAKVPAEVPQGTILIQVIAQGYQTFGHTFEVNELERTIDVKLNSPQEQYSAH